MLIMPQTLVMWWLVQFYQHLKSSKEAPSSPGVTQFEHTPTSRPQVPGGGQFRVEATTSRAPDIKSLLQTSALETVKWWCPGLLAGREEDSNGSLQLWTLLGDFSTQHALLLAEEPPGGFHQSYSKC